MFFKKTDIKALFSRYFAGECSLDERNYIFSRIEKDVVLKAEFETLENIWNSSSPSQLDENFIVDTDAAWKKVESKINEIQSQPQVFVSYKPKQRKLYYQIAKIAAVFVVGLVLAYFVQTRDKLQTFSSPSNSMAVQTLPDHSSIALNKNSTLKYPKKFGSNERKIYFWGEAFFDITPDSERPFVIEIGDARIKVLGTSFNVKSIPEQEIVEVTVFLGKVLFYAVDENNQIVEQVFLTKEEKATFNKKTKTILKQENKNDNCLSWKTGILTFRGETFDNVLSEIEKMYAVKFNVADKKLLQLKLNATFDNESLDSVLEILKLVHHVEFIPETGGYIVKRSGS